ncbi:hypothetical protein H0W26_01200, partial [Candidatus Dependentiae bacterium]|nr:hypothetical protein [Candidatus Dependentiae bacterium]
MTKITALLLLMTLPSLIHTMESSHYDIINPAALKAIENSYFVSPFRVAKKSQSSDGTKVVTLDTLGK